MKNKTKLGISTYSYPYAFGMPGFLPEHRMDAIELIDKAAKLGAQVVQIADNYPLHLLDAGKLEEIGRYAAKQEIELEIGTRGICMEHLMRYLQITEMLHGKLLRVVIDSKGDEPEAEEIILRLSRILPLLEKKRIVLGIENHDRLKSAVFARIIRELNSPWAGIVLDTVNSFACEEGTRQVLETLAPYTVNFHMKDFRIDRIPSALGLMVTGTIAGEGRLDFKGMVRRLEDCAQSDFTTVLELWMQPENTMEETLRKENYWVEQSIGNMKRMLREEP